VAAPGLNGLGALAVVGQYASRGRAAPRIACVLGVAYEDDTRSLSPSN
jgi:hypothetical protein